jgi:hypothetical protein
LEAPIDREALVLKQRHGREAAREFRAVGTEYANAVTR